MAIVVKNAEGTAELSCNCETWLRHWEKNARRKALVCWVLGCRKPPEVGAHVIKVGSTDKARYLVPMCQAHNMSKDTLDLNDGVKLVSANKQETCE